MLYLFLKMKNNNKIFLTILRAGLIGGSLDITGACTHFYLRTGKNPVSVLNFVASGVLGKSAFTGESYVPYLGLLLHFFIAFIWVIIFFFLYPKLSSITKNIFLLAAIYGTFIWCFMKFIVLPLSNTPKNPFDMVQFLISDIIIVFAIALPTTIIIGKYYADKQTMPAHS